MAKENVAYLHKGILLGHLKKKKKEEILPYATTRTWKTLGSVKLARPRNTILHGITYVWNLKKLTLQKQTVEQCLPGAGRVQEMGRWCGQGHKTFTVKMNKFWGIYLTLLVKSTELHS